MKVRLCRNNMLRLSPKNKRLPLGQSLLEFVLALFGFFTITFMIVQVSLGFSAANFIQYATFMAARAYQSGYDAESQQNAAGKEVLSSMVGSDGADRFKMIAPMRDEGIIIGKGARVATGAPGSDTRLKNWEQGARYKFKMKLYMMPIIRSGSGKGPYVNLESQTYLGREPTKEECERYMGMTHGPVGSGREKFKDIGFLVDNGC